MANKGRYYGRFVCPRNTRKGTKNFGVILPKWLEGFAAVCFLALCNFNGD